ncbi:hypothetical protein Bbelb_283780 [Branchiostoma belcheri]|nr:hypothetical protein Bbelb_283780 [Branchiostoma belcheri]
MAIERVQRRALRIISLGGRRSVPDLPTLKTRREEAAVHLFERMLRDDHPLHDLVPPTRSAATGLSLRNAERISLPPARTKRLRNSFLHCAIRLYNNRPTLDTQVAADFFDHINQIDDNIKFTQEPSHDNMLPFLDTKTIVEEDGNLRFEVYRKPTHTDQYLAFDSHHPLEHKLAVIKTLFHRADNIVTSDQAKTDEQRHLRGALAKCGYQNWTFNKALKPSDQSKKTQKCKPLTNKNKANITIPYVQGVSEKLRRIFQNFNIATNFKPHSTLRQRLVHPKDRPHKGTKANVIYRLKCEEPNCNNTYIGETSRPLKVRYKEHCRPSANGYSSAIFHHLQHNQGHSFKLESTDVLDRETRWWERGVKEAIYERMYNPTLNREGGYGSIFPALGIWHSQPRGQTTLKLLSCITGAFRLICIILS